MVDHLDGHSLSKKIVFPFEQCETGLLVGREYIIAGARVVAYRPSEDPRRKRSRRRFGAHPAREIREYARHEERVLQVE